METIDGIDNNKWKVNVLTQPKLCIYELFTDSYITEDYLQYYRRWQYRQLIM